VPASDLDFALSLADDADALSLPRFRATDLRVETKPDLTPVTDADRAVERALRERIARERPGEGVLGEEEGDSGGAVRWILDPIDGTKNFSRGIPVWATLIALERDGEVACGVASAPALGHRWWASRGEGAFCNGHSIHASAIADIGGAQLCYDDVPGFEKYDLGDKFLALVRRCTRSRGFGDFWSHMLVAEGAAEIAIEPEVAHWDMAAIKVIVEEAGGRFTNLRGEARADGGSGLSTNGLLHDDVLRAFA
jgi:histidinol-phosphatase